MQDVNILSILVAILFTTRVSRRAWGNAGNSKKNSWRQSKCIGRQSLPACKKVQTLKPSSKQASKQSIRRRCERDRTGNCELANVNFGFKKQLLSGCSFLEGPLVAVLEGPLVPVLATPKGAGLSPVCKKKKLYVVSTWSFWSYGCPWTISEMISIRIELFDWNFV